MTDEDRDDAMPRGCASPPCYMHEVDPAYMGLAAASAELDAGALGRLAETVIREIPDAVIFADREGVIRFWNAGATRIFGFSEEAALGRSLDIIIPTRLRARHWEGFRRMMESGRPRHGPDELLSVPAETRSGETRSIQFTVARVPGEDERIAGVVAILRDVTETYRELKQLRAAAGST